MSNIADNKASQETPTVEIVKDWERTDPFRVGNKNPEKAYKFVDKNKLQRRKHEGWNPVDPESVDYPNTDSEEESGAPQYRDLVLCEMPKKMADQRRAYYESKTKASTLTAKENFRKSAERAGVECLEGAGKSRKFYSFGR